MTRTFLFLALFFVLLSCQDKTNAYVCTPCELACDELAFNKAGICPHCTMDLVLKSSLLPEKVLTLNEINIQDGSGKFLIEGGFDKQRTLVVHYYKPEPLQVDSRTVIVLPGAGRNGNDYRDAWIEKAELYNVLVLSPTYAEKYYPEFWSYNLAGMITDVEINEERTAMTSYTINEHPEAWIFNDFDRIFNLVKKELELTTHRYDLFGHSAGGQTLHRLVLFKPDTKANSILASNSGWYTIPNDTVPFPAGLLDSPTSEAALDFTSKLVLFLGEEDDANETRGDLRHGPEVDKQGLHRLARGQYFYEESKKIAAAHQKDFNWQLVVIPNVGHDYQAMSQAAADYLYEKEN